MPKRTTKAKKLRKPSLNELRAQVDELQRLLRERDVEIGELKNRLVYLQADLENARKRADKEKREAYAFAAEEFLRGILPIVDEFNLALRAVKGQNDEVASGVRMIYENLLRFLQSEGLQEIKAEGEAFDPFVHEAVAYVEGEKEGMVLEVVQKGYRLDARILRPSQVVVSRKEGETTG